MKYIKFIPLIVIGALSITGCGKTAVNQTQPTEQQSTSKDKILETEIITDVKELDNFKIELFNKLENQPTAMNVYHDLKKSIFKYGVSSANMKDALPRLIELQDKLKESSIYSIDFDEDGAKDVYELLLLNTSPMSKASKEDGKLDGKLAQTVDIFVFNNSNSGYTVTDVLIGNFINRAIEIGTIDYNNYVQVKCRLYTDEMSSLIIEPNPPSKIVKNTKGLNVYPVAITALGLKNISMPGEIYFYHKGETDVKDSYVQWISPDKNDKDTYLERNKNYTKTNDTIHMNRTYILVRE